MIREILTDEQWERVAPHVPGKVGDPGRSGVDNRLFFETVLWIVRTGAPWRDIPPSVGEWNSIFQRFNRWSKKGVFERLFETLSGDPDFEYAMNRRHDRSGSPARHWRKRGTQNQAIGRSRGGLTTKIVALVDGLGNLARFILLPGHRHDSVGVPPLIEGIAFDAFFGDKAFDIDWLRVELDQRGAQAVIPPKSNRTSTIACDFHMYRWRHLIEHYFCKLKAFRRIATRYEKTDQNYAAMINLAAIVIALR